MSSSKETFCEAEDRRLEKVERWFSLPNSFKRIGTVLAVLSFLALLINKFGEIDSQTIRLVARKVLLISLLLVVISREKTEDELIAKIRGRAFGLAFVFGVIYAVIMPYFDFAIIKMVKGGAVYEEMNVFQLLLVMLAFYLMFFQFLKKMR